MKKTIGLISLCAVTTSLFADEGILLQRIVTLEERVAKLEEKLAPVLEQERIKGVVAEQQAFARDRMMLDADIYSRHDLQIIEKIYQAAGSDWSSEDARKAVDLLSERYPNANRTGCAILNFARHAERNEQSELLAKAIGPFSGCYYANGVQVGAYARLYLAMRHKKEGKDEAAAKLFKVIREDYPNAIDHKGQLLTSHLEGMD